MKYFAFFSILLLIPSILAAVGGEKLPLPITSAEADAIVEAEMTAKAGREAEARARLEKVPALGVSTVNEAGYRIVMRRVAPKAADAVQLEDECLG